jgi:secreted trypsin-like serine protease
MTPSRLVTIVLCAAATLLTCVPAGAVTYPEGIGDGSSRPWVVAIRTATGDLVCSGTLIAPRVVLTAAHCIDGVPKNVRVHSGSETAVGVAGHAAHPSFDRSTYRHDIGLWYLTEAISTTVPGLAPTSDKALMERHGEKLQVVGWGASESGGVDNRLRWTSQRDISNKGKAVLGSGFDQARMIAAGRWEPRLKKYSGACKGDSGGPLVTPGNRPVVVGVVSFGALRCSSSSPTVYTRVAAYRDWITKTAKAFPTVTAGVVDVTVMGARRAITATVTGAGSQKIELRCERNGTAPLVAVIGEGATRLTPVTSGRWLCLARPAGSSSPHSTIGPVEVS